MIPYNTPYGNYSTRTFSEIWPSVDEFMEDYQNCGIPAKITEDNATTLFYLLYSRYGNSHIASSDENQFKYRVYANIFSKGPTWEKKVDIQDKLRALTEDELLMGSKSISNHAFNPDTAPQTTGETVLDFINEQNASYTKRGKLAAYSLLLETLKTDVTQDFINSFKPLFLKIVAPQQPLWYVTEEEDHNEEG